MTLATADAAGVPWASPVWYAPRGYSELFWVSYPDARHSRNLAERPQLSIVIFDSTVAPGHGQAVYMEAEAAQSDGAAGGLLRPLGGAGAGRVGRTSAGRCGSTARWSAEHWMLGEGPTSACPSLLSLAAGRS